jgi:hydrogenase/urease accessory protein HupE
MTEKIVYILFGLTSILCAGLLYRQYLATRSALLFWSTGGFAGLALANVLLSIDLIVLPAVDLSIIRSLVTLGAMLMLLYGLTRERP